MPDAGSISIKVVPDLKPMLPALKAIAAGHQAQADAAWETYNRLYELSKEQDA